MRQGVDNVVDADNDVDNGLRVHSKMLSNGTFKICGCCTNLIREYATYVWDTKASEKGKTRR